MKKKKLFQAEEAERIGSDDIDVTDVHVNVNSPAK